MSTSELWWCSAAELAALISSREVSSVNVVEAHLERIAATNPSLNAFLHVCGERALDDARQADREISAGNYRGALHGVPVAYKDVIHIKGLPTTAHSKIMGAFIADRDAAMVEKLREAGAITLGKLNTTEFASGGMETYGFARNPWDTDRSPGTSSSGPGSAVASGMIPLAVGSDTGGSARIPAAFCGLYALKPTVGRISSVGMIPVHGSMDTAGPMARTAADVELLLEGLSGSKVGPEAQDRSQPGDGGLKGLRIGLPKQYFFEDIDPAVNDAVQTAISVLRDLGATFHPVELAWAQYSYAAHWCVAYSQAYPRWRERFFSQRDNFGDVYVRKIATWAFLTGDEVATGFRLAELVKQEMASVLSQVDLLLTPTAPSVAPLTANFGGTLQDTTRMTRIASVAGVPALAVPCGFTAEGLPMSMQLIGRPWGEATLLRVAKAYERHAKPLGDRRPSLQPGRAPASPTSRTLPGPLSATSAQVEHEIGWMRQYAQLCGVSFLREDDFAAMASQLAPVRIQLARGRSLVARLDEPDKFAHDFSNHAAG